MKKLVFYFFSFLSLYVSLIAFADQGITKDISNSFAGGSGTKSDPYQIINCQQLQNMSQDLKGNYVLVGDIDCSDTKNKNGFKPIGDVLHSFGGSFNGQNHKIINLYINQHVPYVGLFGVTDSLISNVSLQYAEIIGGTNTGGLVGWSREGAEILHVYSEGNIGSDDIGGGLVGVNNGKISSSSSKGKVSAKNTAGGLVGHSLNAGKITNSYFTGEVTRKANGYNGGSVGNNDYHIDGFIGGLVGNNDAEISSSCFIEGKVSGPSNIGGLVGWNRGNGLIKNSYAMGIVDGVVVGGLVGTNDGVVIQSYSSGKLTGSLVAGGLIGQLHGGSIQNAYYDSDVSGQHDTGKGEPKTASEIMQQATFLGWDFINIWNIINYTDYPKLRWQQEAIKTGFMSEPVLPVILSSSNHNLLSIDGAKAYGKIVVKNNSNYEVKGFKVKGDFSPVVIDTNSTCFKPVAAKNACEFNISYTGRSGLSSKNSVDFEVTGNGDNDSSDYITVNVIDVKSDVFFNPATDDTGVKSISNTVITNLAKVNKNGVDFLYAWTWDVEGRIFKTNDGGTTWLEVYNELADKNVRVFSIDDYLYAVARSEIFKTNDAGKTWLAIGPIDKNILSLHSINGYLYAGTNSGIFKTIDDGKTWIDVGFENEQALTLYSMGGYLYAGIAFKGIFKTQDGGKTWIAAGFGSINENVFTFYLMDSYLYAGTGSSGVVKTQDGGETWIAAGLTKKVPRVIYSIGEYLYSLTEGGIFKTNDGGKTWIYVSINKGLEYFNCDAPALHSVVDGYLFALDNGEIFKTSDGGEKWKKANNGLVPYNSVQALHSMSKYLYAGTKKGVFKTTDGGATWEKVYNGDFRTLYSMNGYLYGGSNDGVFKISDDGKTLKKVYSGNVWALHSVGDCLYAGTNDGIFKTRGNGEIWEKVSNGLTCYNGVRALHSIGIYLYAVIGDSGRVFRTSNGGKVWSEVNKGAHNSVQSLYSVGDSLYAIREISKEVGSEIFKTNDEGKTWAATKLANKFVQVLYLMDGFLYAGTMGNGVFRTNNGGITWTEVSDGLKDKDIRSLYSIDGYLYAGTSNGEVLKMKPSRQEGIDEFKHAFNPFLPRSLLYPYSDRYSPSISITLINNSTVWGGVNNNTINANIYYNWGGY